MTNVKGNLYSNEDFPGFLPFNPRPVSFWSSVATPSLHYDNDPWRINIASKEVSFPTRIDERHMA